MTGGCPLLIPSGTPSPPCPPCPLPSLPINANAQALLAYLRLLLDPSDDASFMAALNTPLRGLGASPAPAWPARLLLGCRWRVHRPWLLPRCRPAGEAAEEALLTRQAQRALRKGRTPSLERCARERRRRARHATFSR